MKRLMGIAVGMMVVGMVATAQGEEDCPGTPWRNSGGKTCIDVGLHSRHGTCLPGNRYETLCDDKKNMIKTCQGPRRCQEEEVHRYRDDGYRWQERDDRYRDDGYRWQERDDRYRDDSYRWQERDDHYRADSYRWQEPCYYWDFIKNQPCPRGYINLDCKAGCDSRESR